MAMPKPKAKFRGPVTGPPPNTDAGYANKEIRKFVAPASSRRAVPRPPGAVLGAVKKGLVGDPKITPKPVGNMEKMPNISVAAKAKVALRKMAVKSRRLGVKPKARGGGKVIMPKPPKA